jgi:hypothetical protein
MFMVFHIQAGPKVRIIASYARWINPMEILSPQPKRMICEVPKQYPVVTNPLNRPFAKNWKRPSHPMGKLEQPAVICFFALKGLPPQQIQTEFSNMYHKQALQLPGWS